jgi:hypothetical protein
LGAVVFILNDTGSALGFVMFKERFTFWVKGPRRGYEKAKGWGKKRRTIEAE